MPTTTPHLPAGTNETSADRLAAANWKSNLAVLATSQPHLADALRAEAIHVSEWLFARDGALTAFTGPGRWWTGCSLPHRAASAMLRSLEVSGVVGCLLDPPHAAHVRVTLDKLRRNQAVVAVCPDLPQLALLLHCDDFSADVAAHRLWYAWGDDWNKELARLFEENGGLPTPSTFVKLPLHDDAAIERLVRKAQEVFSAETTRRADLIRAARGRSAPQPSAPLTIAVIAPSRFRLWDDAPATLAAALPGNAKVLDTDDPAFASPLAIAAVTEGCHALIAADIARVDAPHLLPDELAWITWVTKSRIPPRIASAPYDALLLADSATRNAAIALGWPDDRVAVAGWPARTDRAKAVPKRVAALIADTQPLAPPQRLEEYSSHRLLWEQIVADLHADPFAAIDDPGAYLASHRESAGIDEATFDQRLFLTDLIGPAVAQGLARVLLAAGVPLSLHGKGWTGIDAFAGAASGAVTSREQFHAAVGASALLVDPRPVGGAHPLYALGRTVIRPQRDGAKKFIDAVRRALAAPPAAPVQAASAPVSFELIRSLLRA